MKRKRTYGWIARWTWAVAAGVLFHVALFWSIGIARDTGQTLPPSARQSIEIQYFDAETAEGSEALSQQMSLYDPRPLLLPTEWNAANASRIGDFLQEEEEIFPDFVPMFELEDGDYLDDFGSVPANYGALSAAQADFDFPLFGQLGRKRQNQKTAQDTGVEIAVVDPQTGREVARKTIYNSAAEELEDQWPSWQPAALLVTVEESFPVGGATVARSSGSEEADRRLAELVRFVLPDLGRLEDGVYLVEIAP